MTLWFFSLKLCFTLVYHIFVTIFWTYIFLCICLINFNISAQNCSHGRQTSLVETLYWKKQEYSQRNPTRTCNFWQEFCETTQYWHQKQQQRRDVRWLSDGARVQRTHFAQKLDGFTIRTIQREAKSAGHTGRKQLLWNNCRCSEVKKHSLRQSKRALDFGCESGERALSLFSRVARLRCRWSWVKPHLMDPCTFILVTDYKTCYIVQ